MTTEATTGIEIPAHIRGLIFDCDGTLVDSMPIHMQAWRDVLEEHGAPWDFDFIFSKKGVPTGDIVRMHNAAYNGGLDVAHVVRRKEEMFLRRLHELQPITAVVHAARQHRAVLPMSVASGSTKRMVDVQLHALGIHGWFDPIVTADDRLPAKPAPDMFLEAARRMGVPPEYCQVFEDGDLGLDAARAAGMLATDIRPFAPPVLPPQRSATA